MIYTQVDGISVSRIVLGIDFFGTAIPRDEAEAMLELYVRAGGNMVDTGHVYADWVEGAERSASEKCLGRILAGNAYLREKLMVCTKGAHYDLKDPHKASRVRPKEIWRDLEESLEYLQRDSIDLYWLHRDDPHYPVEPIMDTLLQAVDAGKVVRLGASNWSDARIESANRYTRQQNKKGFVGSQVGYAYMQACSHGGVGAQGDDTMRYLREKDDGDYYRAHPQMAVFAYSSQASGYITKYLQGLPIQDALKRMYDTPLNHARAQRARKVAEELNTTPEAVGLAYLFTRGFTLCAVAGPKNTTQLQNTLKASDLVLTEGQIRYLETDG